MAYTLYWFHLRPCLFLTRVCHSSPSAYWAITNTLGLNWAREIKPNLIHLLCLLSGTLFPKYLLGIVFHLTQVPTKLLSYQWPFIITQSKNNTSVLFPTLPGPHADAVPRSLILAVGIASVCWPPASRCLHSSPHQSSLISAPLGPASLADRRLLIDFRLNEEMDLKWTHCSVTGIGTQVGARDMASFSPLRKLKRRERET